MALSVALKNEIVNFLTSLPNVNDQNDQQAFIHRAMLDEQLQSQITFHGSAAQFFDLLVPTLAQYGQLEDGRNALEAVLEAAKDYVGRDRRTYCDHLIQQLRPVHNGEEASLQFPSHLAFRLYLEGDIQDFNETKRQDLMNAIAAILKIEKSSIRILHITPAK